MSISFSKSISLAFSSENGTPAPFLHTSMVPFTDLKLTSILLTSTAAPEYPIAQSTLPQLASAPNIAALSSDEHITLLATVLAIASSLAPLTTHSSILVAPSPSPAIIRQSCIVTVLRASMNTLKSASSLVILAFPARPLAITDTISLVEVSPSTLIMLKVFCTSLPSAILSISGAMHTSVVINTSMVAILG